MNSKENAVHSNTGFAPTSDDTHNDNLDANSSSRDAALYRQFFGRGRNKYEVYPDYWSKTWGPIPRLGVVYADNEFLAEKIAYDCGILPTPFNCTFGPKFKQINSQEAVKA